RVLLDRAVPVEMIRRDVEQDADGGIEARRKIDLIGRALDHVRAAGSRRVEREDRDADIAAALRKNAAGAEHVADEGGGRRLAVGSGDGNERGARCARTPLAAIELDVADDLDAGLSCERDAPM